jgi:hypothetical protein
MAGSLTVSALVASLAVALAGTGAAYAADVHDEAQPIPLPITPAFLQRPQHPDWYVLPGLQSAVALKTISVPPGCKSQAPFQVSLFNPEGHFIRVLHPQRGPGYAIEAPPYPGRYLLQVAVTDQACAGLQYGIGILQGGNGSGGDQCTGLHNMVKFDSRQLAQLNKLARRFKGARQRYAGQMRALTQDRAMAQAELRKAKC